MIVDKNLKDKVINILSEHKAPNVGALGGMGTRMICSCGYIVDGMPFESHVAEKLLQSNDVIISDTE